MKNHRSAPLLFFFFFFFFFTIINQEPISALSPTPTPSPTLSPTSVVFPSPPPPPPPPSTPTPPLPPSKQLNNIIDALIGAGDFTSWVSILSMANPMVIPLSATIFIPEDNTLDRHHPPIDPFLFPYHIIPQRLAFSDLLLFDADTRLPTLLPGKSISITGNSPDNFTIDDTLITHPDLYTTATIAVHGVAAVLDYSVFGDGIPLLSSPPTATQEFSPPFMPIGETIEWRPSAACSSTHVNFGFLIFCGVLASFSVMQRNPLVR